MQGGRPRCGAYPDPAHVRGITIDALENWLLLTRSVKAQINAAAAWHANLVRFQVLQDKLAGPRGRRFDPGYMRAVEQLTRYALARHLAVVLNAQTETATGYPYNEPLPTPATYAFWAHMAAVFGRNPRVIFDLFNEPRWCNWAQWRAAFQPLVDAVRRDGSRNELWVEGIWYGSTFAGSGGHLLSGQGIVYSFHHPGAPWPWLRPVGPRTWWWAFGRLAAEGYPVVDGEFVNYWGGYDWSRSTAYVAEYLRYLRSHRVGVVAWSLQAGVMTATSNLTVPVRQPHGAGREIWQYFHGAPLPPGPPPGQANEHVPFRFRRNG